MRIVYVRLLGSISESSIPRIHEFDGQDLAITAWSWARLEGPPAPLKGAISAVALARIGDLGPQNLSNLAWA